MRHHNYLPLLLVLILLSADLFAQSAKRGAKERPSNEVIERRKMVSEAGSIRRDKAGLEVKRADVSIQSVGDLAVGYFAGSELVMVELTAFPEGAEESSQYYFRNNQLFLVSTTTSEYTENLFSFDEADKPGKEVQGGTMNEDGQLETDWDWGVEVDSAKEAASWTDPALSMFKGTTTQYFFFKNGHLESITDDKLVSQEQELDFYLKKEEELNHNVVRIREGLSR